MAVYLLLKYGRTVQTQTGINWERSEKKELESTVQIIKC